MGFGSLQHLRNPRSTLRGPKPARYVPPSGFGYPLGGFRPRIPCRFCFAPAALLGFTLRRFPLSEGFTTFRLRRTHLPLATAVFPPPKRQTGPRNLGFWVRAFRECLATARFFKPTITGVSLGFCPSRVSQRRSRTGLLRHSSRMLGRPWRLLTGPTGTSEYLSTFALLSPT